MTLFRYLSAALLIALHLFYPNLSCACEGSFWELDPQIHSDFELMPFFAPPPTNVVRARTKDIAKPQIYDFVWSSQSKRLETTRGVVVKNVEDLIILGGHPEMIGWKNIDLGMEHLLLKNPNPEITSTNIRHDPAQSDAILTMPNVYEDQNATMRYLTIGQFPLSKLITSPGHRVLRDKSVIQGMVQSIFENGSLGAKGRPIVINVVTSDKGSVRYIDIQDGHHRVLAYLMVNSRFTQIKDLPKEELRILINGVDTDGKLSLNKVPFWSINLSFLKNPAFVASTYGTHIALFGGESNYSAGGSRNTLGRTAKLTDRLDIAPRVGVHLVSKTESRPYSTWSAKFERKIQKFDQVLLVPQGSAFQVNRLVSEVKDIPNVNVYLGSLELLRQYVDLDHKLDFNLMVLRQIRQLYATEPEKIELF